MTTLADLQTGTVALDVIVAIEGFESLITTGSTSAAVTAWSGTEWSSAIGGLQVSGILRQSLRPWSHTVDSGHITIGVQPDDDDTLGKLLFGQGAGAETLLTAAIDANDTTVTVKSTSAFASSGTIHIGTEAITYSGKTATTFTGCTRGRYAPFATDGGTANQYGRAHPLSAVGDGYVVQSRVTSKQRTWVGRWVGVWVHSKNSGTLDTKANAHLLFAGRLVEYRDAENGMLYLDVEPAHRALADTVLLRDQWSAGIADGITLRAGDRFTASEKRDTTTYEANDLVVVASGASGSNEINAGRYTLDTLADALNAWFASEKTAPRLTFARSWTPQVPEEDGHSQFRFSGGHSTGENWAQITVPPEVSRFMGWGIVGNQRGLIEGNAGIHHRFDGEVQSDLKSPSTPFRMLVRQRDGANIEIDNVIGTWWDNGDYFPEQIGGVVDATGSFAALRFGDNGPLIICKEVVAGESIVPYIIANPLLAEIARAWGVSIDTDELMPAGVRANEENNFRLTQVAIITGDFATLLTKIVASTGTSAYNHATYDAFPSQLGAAIPWDILGDGWTESVAALTEAGATLDVVIEKPTSLLDVIGSDLVVRLAAPIFHSETLRLTRWNPPSAATSAATLDEDNKATPADTHDTQRTVAHMTEQYLVNTVKLQYSRDLTDGTYGATINLIDRSSQHDTGLDRPVTISLRNTYGGSQSSTAAVAQLGGQLAAVMGVFTRPLHILKRTISPDLYTVLYPGAIVSVSDNFVRDPADGTRGLTNRAAMVIGVEFDLGGWEIDTDRVRPPMGQVELLMWPRENVVAYSPCAQVDDTEANGGYDAGTQTLTFYDHEHSLATDATDLSHFAANDAVRVIEIDPDDPASPLTWITAIDSLTATTATLNDALTGWDATKRYRMISDNYSNATVTQLADCYQADDADGMIVDDITAYEYGVSPTVSTGYEDTGDELPALYAEAAYGDGVPLDTGYERDAARLANNLIRYRTAPVMPALNAVRQANGINSGTHVRAILSIEPLFLAPGQLAARRYMVGRIWARTSGASADLFVSLMRKPPTGTQFWIDDADAPEYRFEHPYETRTVSVSSTTWGASGQFIFDTGIASEELGECYLVVEGEPDTEYRGLAMLQVGAYGG